MKNELKRHKKSDSIKWAFTAIALLLLCVAIVGMGLQLFGKGKLKPSEWFKSDKQAEETETDSGEESADNLITTDFVSNSIYKGVRLSAAISDSSTNEDISVDDFDDTYYDSAYYIEDRATDYKVISVAFEPANTTVKQVKYNASFIRPENIGSAYWTYQNKNANDYIHVDIQGDGSTGHVYCDKPFGNPIALTVSWILDESISASCTCTYRQKISGTTATWSSNALNGLPLNGEVSLDYSCNLDEEYTSPIEQNGITFTARIFTNSDFIDRMSYYGIYNIPVSQKAYSLSSLTVNNTTTRLSFSTKFTIDITFYQTFFGKDLFTDSTDLKRFREMLKYDSIAPFSLVVYVKRGSETLFVDSQKLSIKASDFDNFTYANSLTITDSLVF